MAAQDRGARLRLLVAFPIAVVTAIVPTRTAGRLHRCLAGPRSGVDPLLSSDSHELLRIGTRVDGCPQRSLQP
jgi:hypothetical protein